MDDVKIGFQFLPKHADRIKHAILSIDMVMLDNGMEESILRRDAYLACVDFHILNVLLINLIAVFGQRYTATIIETLKMRPSNSDVNTPNHNVAFLLGIDYRFVHTFHCCFKINDLAFAHATRRGLANAEDLDRAIRPAFSNDNANFRGTNLKTNYQIAACHRY